MKTFSIVLLGLLALVIVLLALGRKDIKRYAEMRSM